MAFTFSGNIAFFYLLQKQQYMHTTPSTKGRAAKPNTRQYILGLNSTSDIKRNSRILCSGSLMEVMLLVTIPKTKMANEKS